MCDFRVHVAFVLSLSVTVVYELVHRSRCFVVSFSSGESAAYADRISGQAIQRGMRFRRMLAPYFTVVNAAFGDPSRFYARNHVCMASAIVWSKPNGGLFKMSSFRI
jgi:hypothetical protein